VQTWILLGVPFFSWITRVASRNVLLTYWILCYLGSVVQARVSERDQHFSERYHGCASSGCSCGEQTVAEQHLCLTQAVKLMQKWCCITFSAFCTQSACNGGIINVQNYLTYVICVSRKFQDRAWPSLLNSWRAHGGRDLVRRYCYCFRSWHVLLSCKELFALRKVCVSGF
jgi:hypothetical protein